MSECVAVPQSTQASQASYSSYFVLEAGSYTCLACKEDPTSNNDPFRAVERQKIIRHVKKEHLNYSHTCNQCSRVFRSKEKLEMHMDRLQHGSEPRSRPAPYSSHFVAAEGCYKCLVCTKFQCRKRQTILRHVKTAHLNYSHICNECSRAFGTEEKLKNHWERHGHSSKFLTIYL